MNIGIIGCGWLGKDLAKSLTNQGYTVFGTRTTIEGIEDLEQNGIYGLLLKLEENSIQVEGQKLFEEADVLIISITPRIRKRAHQTAINELEVLADFVNQLPNSPHIIYLNSTAIYDASLKDCTEDKQELNPPYSIFEEIIKSTKKYTILRLAGLVGTDRIIINRMAGQEREISKNATINLVAKEDVIAVIEAVLLTLEVCTQEIFNVCSSDHPLKHIFYTEQCQQAGLEVPSFKFKDSEEAKKVDNTKIKSVLNLKFKYDKIEYFFNELLK